VEEKRGRIFIHYGSSLTAFELLMANILGYEHRITVAPVSLTTKRTFSVVLLALVDASYKFTITGAGGYGKSSDGGLFTRSILGKSLEANTLNISNSKPPPNSEEPLPFVTVGDEAFPLKKYLLRPYPGISVRNDESKQIYNYRLSRARASC